MFPSSMHRVDLPMPDSRYRYEGIFIVGAAGVGDSPAALIVGTIGAAGNLSSPYSGSFIVGAA
jgi:hypothetical protein